METLLGLTGLGKVKIKAVNLFKLAIKLSHMDPETRKANSFSMNYCFLGNPGTGKTTVARLFAEILYDSKIREKNSFIECTAQNVKEEGLDEFKKLITKAFKGVLFIDEA